MTFSTLIAIVTKIVIMDIYFSKNNLLITASRVIMGIILVILCAKIRIPLKPVPIVLTTVAINFIGLRYRFYEATLSVISYLVIGSVGIYVFASPSASLTGPTGGYLIGYLLSVMLMSKFRQISNIKNKFLSDILTSAIGISAIYIPGILWLSKFTGGYEKAINLGLSPFILPGIIKIFILCFILKLTRK